MIRFQVSRLSKNWPAMAAGVGVAALLMTGCASEGFSQTMPAEISEELPEVAPAMSSSFDATLTALRAGLDARMEAGVPVPVPMDAGGGYTHEQHKQNGKTIYEAGMLYQITGEARYRDFAVSILTEYADLYPTLDLHPEQKEQSPGRLFWQSLNEAMWLVYSIQGYDAIRADLSPETRDHIETGVLRPVATFLSEGQPSTFNKIHNHGTWATAAVGMTGYTIGEERWVEQALRGLDLSGDAGFLRQLDVLFSPDGYYAEGPYYQRFALMPFVLFAQAIEENHPDFKIFEYRDDILQKAIMSTIQQSYGGRFFPINDAIREKGLNTVELRYGVAIAYGLTGDDRLLSIAALQNGVVPTPEGKALADAMDAGLTQPFPFQTLKFRDGSDGDRGALTVLRSGPAPDDAAVVFKAGSQGLGHGHFDWLGLIYYDNGDEVIADYGASRFLNVEPKNGGHYLPENTTWAKQTVAHNTLVVDQSSQFAGNWRVAEKTSPTIMAFDDTPGASFTAAEIGTAYDGVNLQRVVAMVDRDGGGQYIVDIMRGASDKQHIYDLPVHFKGQLIETSLPFEHETEALAPLGSDAGYQHLWRTAQTPVIDAGTVSDLSLVIDDQFYTFSHISDQAVSAYLTRLGANDPDNNLRNEQAVILRTEASDAAFFSVYERHGRYDNDEEITVYAGGSVQDLQMERLGATDLYSLTPETGGIIRILIADSPDQNAKHTITRDGETMSWTGPVGLHVSEQKDKKSNLLEGESDE